MVMSRDCLVIISISISILNRHQYRAAIVDLKREQLLIRQCEQLLIRQLI